MLCSHVHDVCGVHFVDGKEKETERRQRNSGRVPFDFGGCCVCIASACDRAVFLFQRIAWEEKQKEMQEEEEYEGEVSTREGGGRKKITWTVPRGSLQQERHAMTHMKVMMQFLAAEGVETQKGSHWEKRDEMTRFKK